MSGIAAQAESTLLLEAEADRAAGRGDASGARRLLEQVTQADPGRMEPWLKLAAMCRASGDSDAALAAVSGALRIDPLAFLPLLLKANLLDGMGRTDEAGEAYGHALAQLPDEVPPHLLPGVTKARERHREHVGKAEARLAEASRTAVQSASPRERDRLARFQSNILRKTQIYHSEPTHFHYPGLAEREFHDREDFPWLAELEAATEAITADFHRVMAAERAELVPYVEYPDDVPLRQWAALNRSRDWTAIHLLRNGTRVEANARHCPETMALVARFDPPRIAGRSPNAMFSLLAPGAHIPPHTGVANTRLVVHLPLIVPEGCWFRVGADTREWRRGQAWAFDDTIEHEAKNPSDQLRVILIIDTWHPGLSPAERRAVAAIMEAIDPSAGVEGL